MYDRTRLQRFEISQPNNPYSDKDSLNSSRPGLGLLQQKHTLTARAMHLKASRLWHVPRVRNQRTTCRKAQPRLDTAARAAYAMPKDVVIPRLPTATKPNLRRKGSRRTTHHPGWSASTAQGAWEICYGGPHQNLNHWLTGRQKNMVIDHVINPRSKPIVFIESTRIWNGFSKSQHHPWNWWN